MRKLQNIIPENSIQTIHKSFIRPHLDDGDINYHQPKNRSFCQKIEFIQYQAALAITGVIHGTSQTNLYNELGISQWNSGSGSGISIIFSKCDGVVYLNI